MTTRIDLIQCLVQLDELDKARSALKTKSTKLAALTARIEELRQRLPTAILKHYDQRRARNKPTIAPVKRGICGGCHISMTRSSAANLHRSGGAINVCENCGVFIYLDDGGEHGSDASSAR
jgi:predicted  nucleic acid-binding Zn-ribbon protein